MDGCHCERSVTISGFFSVSLRAKRGNLILPCHCHVTSFLAMTKAFYLMRLPCLFVPRNDNTLFIPLTVEASAVILAIDSVTFAQFHAFLETVLLFKIGL